MVCVDEKSQIQALDRTRQRCRSSPASPSSTHDYIRHGTTTLFAALEIATGKITADACYPRHRHQEFLAFLKQVAAAHPAVDLHVVLDNYGTHKHPDIAAGWPENQRITLHFTPTSCSWLNMVEIFFGIITRQAIRRGTFTAVRELTTAIGRFIDAYNDRCQPFTWTKDADQLLAKIKPSNNQRHATLGTLIVLSAAAHPVVTKGGGGPCRSAVRDFGSTIAAHPFGTPPAGRYHKIILPRRFRRCRLTCPGMACPRTQAGFPSPRLRSPVYAPSDRGRFRARNRCHPRCRCSERSSRWPSGCRA